MSLRILKLGLKSTNEIFYTHIFVFVTFNVSDGLKVQYDVIDLETYVLGVIPYISDDDVFRT